MLDSLKRALSSCLSRGLAALFTPPKNARRSAPAIGCVPGALAGTRYGETLLGKQSEQKK
jgi:hypothetical protein